MSANTLPIPIAFASANRAHAKDLGKIYMLNGSIYRLAKASAALAAAAQKIVVTALSSGVPTWLVTTTTTANDHLVAGFVPVGQKGSDGSTGLLINDYFLLLVAGPTKGLSAAAIAAGALIGASATAGSIDDLSVTAGVGAVGVALEAAAGAAESTDIMVRGLI